MKMGRYPGCEVHSGSSVQQQRGDIHVAVVSRDVQRGEAALLEMEKRREGEIERKRTKNKGRKC